MNEDMLPKILEEVKKAFEEGYTSNIKISSLVNKVDSKSATYIDANSYAIEVGKILANTFKNKICSKELPDGRMYYNIAKRLVDDTLKNNHRLISDYTVSVQKELNRKAKLSLAAKKPKVNEDRIRGIVERISKEEDYDKIKWILDEPVINFSQAIVDDAIQENAAFHEKAGLHPKITRLSTGKCCEWCSRLVGTYDYLGAPSDVFHRHQNCRCNCDYNPGDGRTQDVWSKIWKKNEIKDRRNKRIEDYHKKLSRKKTIESIKKDMRRIDMATANADDIIKLGKRVNEEFKIADHLGDKKELKSIFSNFREMGGKVPRDRWTKRQNRVVRKQLEEAFSNYPAEWSKIFEKEDIFLETVKKPRGYFKTRMDKNFNYIFQIASEGKRVATPYHEIGHIVENCNPDVCRIEKEWLEKRTKNEKEVKLASIFPELGYGRKEVTKKDDFISPYIGKQYKNASEVLSMGLQGIYTPEEKFKKSYDSVKGEYIYKSIADDEEYLNLIIGIILKG